MVSREAFYFESEASVAMLETISVTHPNFSQDYHIVRNDCKGMTAITEDDDEVDFIYYPLLIQLGQTKENLDQTLDVTIGDLGTILPAELKAVRLAGGTSTKPELIYRTYRSDDLSEPMDVFKLEVFDIVQKYEGSVLKAKAPSLNRHKTGMIYSFEKFPMLRAWI